MNHLKTPARPVIEQFKYFTRLCIEQGLTLPQLATVLIEEMERQTPSENRIYAGVCKTKWVEVSMIPWQLKKPIVDEKDIEMGWF